MGETGTPPPTPWSGQTMGQRVVTAAWHAVAAHLAATAPHQSRVAAGGAGELDAAAPDAALPAAIADRLR